MYFVAYIFKFNNIKIYFKLYWNTFVELHKVKMYFEL